MIRTHASATSRWRWPIRAAVRFYEEAFGCRGYWRDADSVQGWAPGRTRVAFDRDR